MSILILFYRQIFHKSIFANLDKWDTFNVSYITTMLNGAHTMYPIQQGLTIMKTTYLGTYHCQFKGVGHLNKSLKYYKIGPRFAN